MRVNNEALTKKQFFEKIKKVTIKKFRSVIEADGEAEISCYRCGSKILEVPIESTDIEAEDQDLVSFLRPSKSEFKYEDDEDNDEYDLSGYHYKVICQRCTAEMTFNVAHVVSKIEKFYNKD